MLLFMIYNYIYVSVLLYTRVKKFSFRLSNFTTNLSKQDLIFDRDEYDLQKG